jgi:hypothetical protein
MSDYDHFAAAAIFVSLIIASVWRSLGSRQIQDDPHASADGDWPGPRG